jgi:endonuclease/exonuclease/phosphatase family metal-dependent hydrolase
MTEQPDDFFSLNVFCCNVQHSNPTTHAILRELSHPDSKTDIVIITEPWMGTIRQETLEKGTVHHPEWTCFMPRPLHSAKVSLYLRNSSPIRIIQTNLDDTSSDDIISVQAYIIDTPILIYAVYNSPSTFHATSLLMNRTITDIPTILCGDFNLHAPEWDETVTHTNEYTDRFLDWLTINSITPMNDPEQPTFHGPRYQSKKVDDLVLVNAKLFDEFDMGPVTVHSNTHFVSDHYPISFVVHTQIPIPPPRVPRFTFSEHRREKWEQEINTQFSLILNNSSPSPTTQDLDKLADDILNAFTTTTEKVMKKKKNSNYEKHWWNADVAESLEHARGLSRAVRESPNNPYLYRQYTRAKKTFKARVHHAKRAWATERLEGATSSTVWSFIKWYKHGGKRSRPLYSSPSHVPAENEHERAQIFAKQFFPPPPPVQPYSPLDEPYPQRSHHPLIPEEIESAISSCRTHTAEGPSHVGYLAIKWAWRASPDLLIHFFSHCINLGHYPKGLKQSITAVVPKPKKADYTTPSAYRPIQLLECLGKILDKIMARRIQHEVAKLNLVPQLQFGGRNHSSTIDAGLTFTQDIHDAWKKGNKASALFFDISGYFNFVNHEGLIARLNHLGFAPETILFIRSFLIGRTTTFSYDGVTSAPFNISNGIPQGSPLSPILSIIYGADLLKVCDPSEDCLTILSYVDDGTILATSKSLETNIELLRNAYEIIFAWLKDNGLEVQPEKLELMHFTKGPDPSSPALKIADYPTITAPKNIRWLGFFLDRHLNFTHHSKVMAARAAATIRAMGILGNTV